LGWGSPKAEAQRVYETYREAGGSFIDTANFYTGGTSEKFVGEFIKGHRDSVVLATKYSNAVPGNDPNAAGNHRKSMTQALEASLACCSKCGTSDRIVIQMPAFKLPVYGPLGSCGHFVGSVPTNALVLNSLATFRVVGKPRVIKKGCEKFSKPGQIWVQ
jgi:Aldo/keto reductase family